MFGGMITNQQDKKTKSNNVDLLNMDDAMPPSNPRVQQRNSDDIMDIMGDITGGVTDATEPNTATSAFGFDLGGGDNNNNNETTATAATQQNGISETTAQEQKRKKSEYAYLDVLANDANVSRQDASTDILNMMSNTTAPSNNTQPQTTDSSGPSAFGLDLGASASTAPDANGGGSSAFGFDLGGGGGSASNQTNQSNVSSMNSSMSMMNNNKNSGSPLMQGMGMNNNSNNMMTQQMLQQNNQMGQMRNNNMAQMNQMQAMMQQMQAMNMNPMQMQQMQAMMMNQQNANMFQNAMTNANNPQQQQRSSGTQQYGMGHNDPFANIGRSNQSQPPVPKKSGPDPFAQFGLSSMK